VTNGLISSVLLGQAGSTDGERTRPNAVSQWLQSLVRDSTVVIVLAENKLRIKYITYLNLVNSHETLEIPHVNDISQENADDVWIEPG
jgi:hypothetical protein